MPPAQSFDVGRSPRLAARARRGEAFQPRLGRADVQDHGHGYGFGWGIQTQFGRRQFVHAGGINGFSVVVSLYPDDDLFIAVLANIQAAPVQKIARDLAALTFRYYGEEAALVLDAALLADYVGTYRLASGRALTSRRKGARLFAETGDHARQELRRGGRSDLYRPPDRLGVALRGRRR